MDIHITLAGRGDLTARIYRQLLDAILDGRLRAGERLPPTRELARHLAVSRNTVAAAYDRLTAEGFLVGRVGAGTFVCDEAADRIPDRSAPSGGAVTPRQLWRAMPAPPGPARGTPDFNFDVGIPDPHLFPLESWRRIVAGELRIGALSPTSYGDPSGHPALRTAIARHIGVSRSVRAGADDVLVTQGAQQALDLVGRILIEPGDCVAVEEPGYRAARLLFQSLGARIVGVPVDGEGLDVSALPAEARLVYTTPSHQFPLGVPMSLRRRSALLAWAKRNGAVIVEDDYDSEFRFADRPLEPLQALDQDGRVVYVGSFSKVMLPTLRLGFLVAPTALRTALRTAKQLTDWHGDQHTQGAMARFIDEGLLARHLRRANKEYAARHGLIHRILRRDFADWLEPVPSAAGLHLCALLRPGVPMELAGVVRQAAQAGVRVRDLDDYRTGVGRSDDGGTTPGGAPTDARPGLVLGYGAIPLDRIAPGLRRLAASCRAGCP
ncbi:PLP-dependent aminotransferase family protein [Micromonospora polyrhachis]|uniref:GntR family transcriptional regulator/MocR family aminotransferase n=1 Tax=Micromonospora polyrhachis TaxID=1282883 RepID=A0A7W7SWD8_9ACTN|nr:PLP-dependent aminotransferase family protein [Micromonospora polyrhachis]MBB4962212.1 GntR family transcriptional regulator/MocR family aminotransferase [Micromonospora polyrhachis]